VLLLSHRQAAFSGAASGQLEDEGPLANANCKVQDPPIQRARPDTRANVAGGQVRLPACRQSDRNIGQIFPEDSSGAENLVVTLMAIPDYLQ